FERDGVLLIVVHRLGHGAEVDVAGLSVSLLQIVESLADECGVEPIAVLDVELRAERLGVIEVRITGKRDSPQPIALTFFNGHQNIDTLAAVGPEGEPVEPTL